MGRKKKSEYPKFRIKNESDIPILVLSGPRMIPTLLPMSGDDVTIEQPGPHRVFKMYRVGEEFHVPCKDENGNEYIAFTGVMYE